MKDHASDIPDITPRWLRPRAAAVYCGVHERTFRLWMAEGLIAVYKPSPHVALIDRAELDEMILNARNGWSARPPAA